MTKLRWLALFVGVIVAVLAVLLVFNLNELRAWRARQLGGEALQAMKEDDFPLAQQKALAAFQLAPAEPAALRAAAQLNARQGHPQTYNFYQALLRSGEASEDDQIEAARWAARLGKAEEAESLLVKLEKNKTPDAKLQEVRGELAIARGDLSLSEIFLRESVKKNPANREERCRLAEILIRSGEPDKRDEALLLLKETGKSGFFEPALLLQLSPALPPEDFLAAAQQLFSAKEASVTAKLAAANVLYEIEPARHEELLAKLDSLFSSKDPEAYRDYLSWLVRHGENARVRTQLTLTEALQRKDFFLVWLDATAGLGQWTEVQTVIEQRTVPLDESLKLLYHGRALSEQGNDAAAKNDFRRALAAASRDPEQLLYLAGYLHRGGFNDLVEEALRSLTLDPAVARTAFAALLAMQRERKDTTAVRKTLEELVARDPNDQVAQSDLRYMRLLQGERSADIALEARRAFDREPILPYRMVYAFALLQTGQKHEAMALFEGADIPFHQLLPWQQAIFAAVLRANGLDDSAQRVAASIDTSTLSAEERALLRNVEK